MARPKGSPKLGGRKKGTPNKLPAVSFVESLLAEKFDIAKEMIALYRSSQDDHLKLKILEAMATYRHVKPVAEPQLEQPQALQTVATDNLLELVKK